MIGKYVGKNNPNYGHFLDWWNEKKLVLKNKYFIPKNNLYNYYIIEINTSK